MTIFPPAFVLSGVSSGSGKTTVSLGLMAAFCRRGLRVAPFKCGPDFIDPGLHQLVTGNISRNIDLWMMGEEFTRRSFTRNAAGADIAIIEGVMGMFDGGLSSSATLAKKLDLPNILVIDARSMAESAAAIVKGFESLDKKSGVAGVILNRIGSERHLQLVKEAIEKHCKAEVLGYLPRSLEFSIPSRHLGLLTGDEAPISKEAVKSLAKAIEQHIDLDRIISLCQRDNPADTNAVTDAAALSFEKGEKKAKPCKIAVAKDKAFCFYYQDNFDLLEAAGAELCFFSPLQDKAMPKADMLYLGGGYPELYAKELSENSKMLQSIREFAHSGGHIFAECGGFMYLTEGIDQESENGGEGQAFFPLLGIFPVRAKMNKRRTSLGYRELTTVKESFFGPVGTILRGHEFHYSSISPMPEEIERIFSVNNGEMEGYRKNNIVGGYMHLHFGFTPQVVSNLLESCK